MVGNPALEDSHAMNLKFRSKQYAKSLTFADGVCARETLPTWERFWDDCIQTKIRKSQLGAAKPVEQVEDVALLAGSKKGKGKKQASTSGGGGKGKGKGMQQVNTQKDYSKVKCWNC